ncbi:hypothetical protein ABG067_005538 [Albugo candida]
MRDLIYNIYKNAATDSNQNAAFHIYNYNTKCPIRSLSNLSIRLFRSQIASLYSSTIVYHSTRLCSASLNADATKCTLCNDMNALAALVIRFTLKEKPLEFDAFLDDVRRCTVDEVLVLRALSLTVPVSFGYRSISFQYFQ